MNDFSIYLNLLKYKARGVIKNWPIVLIVLSLVVISVDTVFYDSSQVKGYIHDVARDETLSGTEYVSIVQLDNGEQVKAKNPRGYNFKKGDSVLLLKKESFIANRHSYEIIVR